MSYLAKNYNRKKISFVRGKGSYLYSASGKKYLDFVQGIAVNCLGHAHPELIKILGEKSLSGYMRSMCLYMGYRYGKPKETKDIHVNEDVPLFID